METVKTQPTTSKSSLAKIVSNSFKAVFIDGESNNQQKAVIFLIIAIPAIACILLFGHLPLSAR